MAQHPTATTEAGAHTEDYSAAAEFSGETHQTAFEARIDRQRLETLARHMDGVMDTAVPVTATDGGLLFRGSNAKHTAGVDVWVPAASLPAYECATGGVFGIDAGELVDVARHLTADTVGLAVEPVAGQTPKLVARDDDSPRFCGVETVVDRSNLHTFTIPDLMLPHTLTVDSVLELREWVRDHTGPARGKAVVMTAVAREFGADTVVFESDAPDIGHVAFTDDDDGVTVDLGDSNREHPLGDGKHDPEGVDGLAGTVVAQTHFSANLLRGVVDRIRKQDAYETAYRLQFGHEYPLIAEREVDAGHASALVAPRITR